MQRRLHLGVPNHPRSQPIGGHVDSPRKSGPKAISEEKTSARQPWGPVRRVQNFGRFQSSVAVGIAVASLVLGAIAPAQGVAAPRALPLHVESLGESSTQTSVRSHGYSPYSGPAASLSIPLGSAPLTLAFDSANENVYVGMESDNLTVVNSTDNSVAMSIPLPSGVTSYPTAETLADFNNYVYVAGYWTGLCSGCNGPWIAQVNGWSNTVTATNTSLEGVGVSDYIPCLGYDPSTRVVYACDYPAKLLLVNGVLDTITESVSVGSNPSAVALDTGDSELYVANRNSNNVTVIREATNTVAGSIPVGTNPDAIAFDATNGDLYVANNRSGNVSVINGASNSVIATISVGCGPDAVVYSADTDDVYVANSCSNDLSVVDGSTNSVIGSIPVGSYPAGIAYDPATEDLYVANWVSDNLTVVSAVLPAHLYSIQFEESGLPVGLNWSVSVNGVFESSTTSTIVFPESNGSYGYYAEPVGRFAAYPQPNPIRVDGGNVTVSITYWFTTTFTVDVVGLPGGVLWSFAIMNSTEGFTLTGSSRAPNDGGMVFANWTYTYYVTFPPAYASSDVVGNATVGPQGLTVTVTIAGGSGPSTLLPWALVLGAVAAAGATVGLSVLLSRRRPPASTSSPRPPP